MGDQRLYTALIGCVCRRRRRVAVGCADGRLAWRPAPSRLMNGSPRGSGTGAARRQRAEQQAVDALSVIKILAPRERSPCRRGGLRDVAAQASS